MTTVADFSKKSERGEIFATIGASDLRKALAEICRVLPKEPKHLILGTCLIVLAPGEGITLAAFNLERGVTVCLSKCKVEHAFSGAISGHLLKKALNKIEGALSLSVSGDLLILTSSTSALELRFLEGGEWLALPEFKPPEASWKAPRRFLMEAIAHLKPCIKTGRGSSELAGVNLRTNGAAVTMNSCNGVQAAQVFCMNAARGELDATIPCHLLEFLPHAEEVKLSFDDEWVTLQSTSRLANICRFAKLLSSGFPNIFGEPKTGGLTTVSAPSCCFTIFRSEFMRQLDIAHFAYRKKIIRLHATGNYLKMIIPNCMYIALDANSPCRGEAYLSIPKLRKIIAGIKTPAITINLDATLGIQSAVSVSPIDSSIPRYSLLATSQVENPQNWRWKDKIPSKIFMKSS